MNALKDFGNITIIGRRWFERTNGNTYHSVQIYVDGEQIAYVPFTYGDNDQYRQTAFTVLQNAGYYEETDYIGSAKTRNVYADFVSDQIKHREKFIFSVSDVSRKKDL